MIGDPTRLQQVMLIFLSNALKFTSVGHAALEVSVDGVDDVDSDEESTVGDHRPASDDNEDLQDGSVVLKFEISDTGTA